MKRLTHNKIEYGDFQTPLELANKVCQKLLELGISPDIVIEPTCGLGAFIEASAHSFPSIKKIMGLEINQSYLEELEKRKKRFPKSVQIELKQGDFFKFEWKTLLNQLDGSVLVLGNFPWVTNSEQGAIGSANLPKKFNFQHHSGLDAITGKSNFDISEWMLIQTMLWLRNRDGYLAMLCKTSVARKFLNHLHANQIGLSHAAVYGIDAKKYFGASVEACLLLCQFNPSAHNYDYNVYPSLDSEIHYRVGHRNGITVRDLDTFEKYNHLYGSNEIKWRSGVKHDCSEVMELQEVGGSYLNGLGEVVEIEPDFLFPLLKGSDVANNRVTSTNRYVLVTQGSVGEPTDMIRRIAPKTWAYLEAHAKYFDSRKSKIYQNNPRFSIFGVGLYTFSPWKVAICGLYKTLDFRLVGEIKGKPVVFDDTVYFLSFDNEPDASKVLSFLTSSPVMDFLSALIFWDEKRPIKTSVLNSLSLEPLKDKQTLRLF